MFKRRTTHNDIKVTYGDGTTEMKNQREFVRKGKSKRRHLRWYYKSDNWKQKRKARLKLDNYRCQKCLSSKNKLEVHHKHYRNLGNEKVGDLVTLCVECHKEKHSRHR